MTTSNIMTLSFSTALFAWAPHVAGFTVPTAFASRIVRESTLLEASWLTSLPLADGEDLMNQVVRSDTASQAIDQVANSGGGSLMDTVTTVLTFLFAGVLFFFGLTYMMAAFIIPQAAKELERQTKELDPSLWEEYQAKLQSGETMDMRPDLMQELGNKVQVIMAEKFDRMQKNASMETGKLENRGVVDVEVISMQEDAKEPKKEVSEDN
jgi:hypothetical protein